MNLKRVLFKYGKAPVMNKLANVKMTEEAKEFLEDYSKHLHLELHNGIRFTNGLSAILIMKKYLAALSPFVYEVSMRQKNAVYYLPIQVMIYFIVRKLQPKIAIETGVEKGGSTYAILEAMKNNNYGYLCSIDIEKYYKYNKKYVSQMAPLVGKDLKNRWTFICGDAQKELGNLLNGIKGDIDFFLAGQSHTYKIQRQEGELAWSRLRKGGIFVLDRPDFSDYEYQEDFVVEHKSEIDWTETFPEGRVNDSLRFTVFLKK